MITRDRIKAIFQEYGRDVNGREFALIHAISEAVAPQRTWVGLTDEEILSWWSMDNGFEEADMCSIIDFRRFVEEVEAKLKAKNERKEKNNGSW